MDYLIEMDVEVDYSPAEAMAPELSLSIEQAREAGLGSLIKHVDSAARAAVRECGQKWGGGTHDPDGEWPRFSARFQATDAEQATAVYDLWAAKVQSLNGTGRILRASLRGSDGINLQYMDEDLQRHYEEIAAQLPPETRAKLNELMDPERQ